MPSSIPTSIPLLAQLGPPLALLLRRKHSAPLRWVAAGAALSVLAEIVEHSNSDPRLLVLETPVLFTAYLMAVSLWQVSDVERTALRFATFALLIVYTGLILFVPVGTHFSHLGSPTYAALLCLGAIWALTRRALRLPTAGAVFRTDWAWVLGGLAFYGAVRLVSQPLGVALMTAQRPDLYQTVWEVRAVGIALAFLAITVGCWQPPAPAPDPR